MPLIKKQQLDENTGGEIAWKQVEYADVSI